ncbi:hypothetical protein ABBQ32_004004 [Trebouxia sp. C0010 RCD-2024]
MIGGTFRQSLGPLFAPCASTFPIQQLISLKQFSPTPRVTKVVARATATLQPARQKTQPSEAQWAAEFRSLGLSPELLVATQEHGLTEPTEIQAAAIPQMMQGGDVLLASHTGSGKTLAYLLPLVHQLRQQEQEGQQSKPKRPRAVVLGPTRELTDQILQVAKSLCHHARFRSACVNGGGTYAQQAAALATPLDILIATPQKLLQHAEKGNVYYGDVQYVVLDEADTMFDRGFGPEVEKVLGPLRSKPQPAQCILVAATLTKPIRRLLEEKFPDMRRIETKSLHKGVAGARHTFLKQQPGQDKLNLLLQVVEGEQRRGQKVMVFCNTLDSCRAADKFLQEHAVPSLTYHGDVPLDGRRQAILSFAQGVEDAGGGGGGGRGSFSQPILVCTDLAARGLDIPGHVDHVVNFDFPYNAVDYIHRTGRTARAGQKGRVSSLVAKGDQVLASRIDQALQQGLPMDELSADRRSLPPNMRPKAETLQRRFSEKKASQNRGVRGAARFESSSSARRTAPAAAARGSRPASSGRPAGAASGRPSKPAFGNTSKSASDRPSKPANGRPSKPAFSSPFKSTYGSTSKSAPGRPSKSTFGSTSKQAYGRPSKSTFGSSSKPAYGRPSKSAFGSPSKSASGRPFKSAGSSTFDKAGNSAASSSKPKNGRSSFGNSKSSTSASAGRSSAPSFGSRFGKSAGGSAGRKKGLGANKSYK